MVSIKLDQPASPSPNEPSRHRRHAASFLRALFYVPAIADFTLYLSVMAQDPNYLAPTVDELIDLQLTPECSLSTVPSNVVMAQTTSIWQVEKKLFISWLISGQCYFRLEGHAMDMLPCLPFTSAPLPDGRLNSNSIYIKLPGQTASSPFLPRSNHNMRVQALHTLLMGWSFLLLGASAIPMQNIYSLSSTSVSCLSASPRVYPMFQFFDIHYKVRASRNLTQSDDLPDPLFPVPFGALFAPKPADFWDAAKQLSEKVRIYTETKLNEAAANVPLAAEKIKQFKETMSQVVVASNNLREDIEAAAAKQGLTLDGISDALSEKLHLVFLKLQEEFPGDLPEDLEKRHVDRANVVKWVMDEVESVLVDIIGATPECHIKIHEIRIKVEEVILIAGTHFPLDMYEPQSTLTLLFILGDIADQHPILTEMIIFSGAALLIPSSLVLRPLLGLFGFGPYGPVKGAWYPQINMQDAKLRRTRFTSCLGPAPLLRRLRYLGKLVRPAAGCGHAQRRLVGEAVGENSGGPWYHCGHQ